MDFEGAAVVEWLSSWFAKQKVRGSIPGLATWISEIGYLLLPSRDVAQKYRLKQFKLNPQYNQPTLMKLCRDEVLMVPYKCCCFSAWSGQGRSQNRSRGGGPLL